MPDDLDLMIQARRFNQPVKQLKPAGQSGRVKSRPGVMARRRRLASSAGGGPGAGARSVSRMAR